MPNFALDPSEEELVNHVRMMVANARMEVTAKAPNVKALSEDSHTLGVQAGWSLCLEWMRDVIKSRQAGLGPYDDERMLSEIETLVHDKFREVQAG